jgi:hypothetical protein
LVYVDLGQLAARLRAHLAKGAVAGHRQAAHLLRRARSVMGPHSRLANRQLLEHENDLIAAHITCRRPTVQFWLRRLGRVARWQKLVAKVKTPTASGLIVGSKTKPVESRKSVTAPANPLGRRDRNAGTEHHGCRIASQRVVEAN